MYYSHRRIRDIMGSVRSTLAIKEDDVSGVHAAKYFTMTQIEARLYAAKEPLSTIEFDLPNIDNTYLRFTLYISDSNNRVTLCESTPQP